MTLTSEAETLVRQLMQERGMTFKEAINAAIVEKAAPSRSAEPFRQRTVDLGVPLVPLDHTARLLGELEDLELLRKMDMGK